MRAPHAGTPAQQPLPPRPVTQLDLASAGLGLVATVRAPLWMARRRALGSSYFHWLAGTDPWRRSDSGRAHPPSTGRDSLRESLIFISGLPAERYRPSGMCGCGAPQKYPRVAGFDLGRSLPFPHPAPALWRGGGCRGRLPGCRRGCCLAPPPSDASPPSDSPPACKRRHRASLSATQAQLAQGRPHTYLARCAGTYAREALHLEGVPVSDLSSHRTRLTPSSPRPPSVRRSLF